MRTIRLRFEREVALDPLWFDEQWLTGLVADGLTEEAALREMLRLGWEEDWTSLVEELLGGGTTEERARTFAFEAVTDVGLVEAPE